ncbi:hypothetical protein HOI83_02230 [Candidatus Uhrbacteria bacterium]|jgi:hypothetical protein|nr:hypothetical protein [Candidatus Uhrbacteria bacterium]
MPHPWSKMSEEEFARRKGVVQLIMLGGGVVILVLFIIQLNVSLNAENEVVDNDPLAAGQEFLRSMVNETQQPIEDIGVLTNEVTDIVNSEVRQVEAKEALIDKMKEGLAAEAPVDTGDDGTGLIEEVASPTGEGSTHNDELDTGDDAVDDGTWTYNDDVEETL